MVPGRPRARLGPPTRRLLVHCAFLEISGFPFLFGLSAVFETQPGKKCKEILRRLEEYFCVLTLIIFGAKQIAKNSLTEEDYFYRYLICKQISIQSGGEQKKRMPTLSRVAATQGNNAGAPDNANHPSQAQKAKAA